MWIKQQGRNRLLGRIRIVRSITFFFHFRLWFHHLRSSVNWLTGNTNRRMNQSHRWFPIPYARLRTENVTTFRHWKRARLPFLLPPNWFTLGQNTTTFFWFWSPPSGVNQTLLIFSEVTFQCKFNSCFQFCWMYTCTCFKVIVTLLLIKKWFSAGSTRTFRYPRPIRW